MAISAHAKQLLDRALEKASKEGYAIWGFIVSCDQADIQPFSNATEGVQDFIANVEEGARVVKAAYLTNNEA